MINLTFRGYIMTFCPACGGWIPDGETICYKCGYELFFSSDEYDDEEDY